MQMMQHQHLYVLHEIKKLLQLCDEYADEHDLIFNGKKSQCMIFRPHGVIFDNPHQKLKDNLLSFDIYCIYLGTHIELKVILWTLTSSYKILCQG